MNSDPQSASPIHPLAPRRTAWWATWWTRGWPYLAIGLVLWGLLIAIYAVAGSFAAEFSGADEAAYVVSGIMVREYLAGPLWQGVAPLTFAQAYYAQYPKVAIGHWPPVFFFVQGLWYLLTGASRGAVLALSAAISSLFAVCAVALCRRDGLRWSLAIAAGVTVALLPLHLNALLEIGSDVIAGIAILGAAWSAERWIADRSPRSGAALALTGTVAVLTKASAFLLVVAVPLALLLTARSVRALWSRDVWRVLVVGGLLTLPWYIVAQEWVLQEILPGAPRSFVRAMGRAAQQNTWHLLSLGSVLLMPLVLLSLRSGWYRRAPVMAMLPIASWIFLSVLTPHTEARLFLPVLPVLVFAAAVAADRIMPRRPELVLLLVLVVAHLPPRPLHKPAMGFVPAVAWLQQQRPDGGDRILVTGNSNGEGAFISELALHEPRPRRTIVRATKLLQTSRWMGDGLQLRVHSAADVDRLLAEQRITLVVRHTAAGGAPAAYEASLDEALRQWRLVHQVGDVRLYEPRSATRRPMVPPTAQTP